MGPPSVFGRSLAQVLTADCCWPLECVCAGGGEKARSPGTQPSPAGSDAVSEIVSGFSSVAGHLGGARELLGEGGSLHTFGHKKCPYGSVLCE